MPRKRNKDKVKGRQGKKRHNKEVQDKEKEKMAVRQVGRQTELQTDGQVE